MPAIGLNTLKAMGKCCSQGFWYSLLLIIAPQSAMADVRNFSKPFFIKLNSAYDSYELGISPQIGGATKILYRPNVKSVNGVDFGYKSIAASLRFPVSPSSDSEAKMGKTEYTDSRLSLALGSDDQYWLSIYNQKFKGMYIVNSWEIDSTLQPGYTLLRSDLEISGNGVTAIYLFSPKKFSLGAALQQTAIQSSPGGSFLIGASYDSSVVKAESSIIPSQLQSGYGNDASLSNLEAQSASAILGFGYTTVAAHGAYISLVASAGITHQQKKYGDGVSSTSESSTSQKTASALVLGQNNDNACYGFIGQLDQVYLKTKDSNLVSQLTSMKIFFGIRF